MPLRIGTDHPQDALDDASNGETIVADPSVVHTLEEPLTVTTPDVTIRGLVLHLAEDTDEDLIEVGADGVTLTDFTLDGNREHQHGERQSSGVLATGVSRLTIANGHIRDVSRHGLRIVDASDVTSRAPGDTIHVERGAVRDVTVRDVRIDTPRRDGCSIEGPDLEGATVENVRTFGSADRGSVEVKDGASEVVVSNCYAEDCRYGVAVQDHGDYPTANVRILGNAVRRCSTLVDAQTSHPPENVAIVGNVGQELWGDGMGGPGGIHCHMIRGLVVASNVLESVQDPGIAVRDCEDVTVTGNSLRDVAVTAITVSGEEAGTDAIQVTNNRAAGGLSLAGDVGRYQVTDNLLDGTIVDDANGEGLVADNLVP